MKLKLIAAALIAATSLSACIVAPHRGYYAEAPGYSAPVAVQAAVAVQPVQAQPVYVQQAPQVYIPSPVIFGLGWWAGRAWGGGGHYRR